MMQKQPKDRRVSGMTVQRVREAKEQLQSQVEQRSLQRWKTEVVKVVEQGLCAKGRADVRQLVMWAVDIAAGKEVDGVVLPRPKLRAATQEWVAATDTEVVKVVGVAAEGTVTATTKQIEAAAVEDG